jgi:hypothetical protein
MCIKPGTQSRVVVSPKIFVAETELLPLQKRQVVIPLKNGQSRSLSSGFNIGARSLVLKIQ